MKNIIAVTSFLVAGTALAVSAPDTSTWSSVDFSILGNNANNYGVSDGLGYVDNGRAGFDSLSVGGESLDSISFSDYSWCVSFSLKEALSGSISNKLLFSTAGGGNGSGYCIGLDSFSGDGYSFSLKMGDGNNQYSDKTLVKTIQNASYNDTLSLLWDASAEKLYFGVGSKVEEIENPSSSYLSLTKTKSGTASGGVSAVDPSGTLFGTNGGATKISGISLKIQAVPEPSTFGLFAGVGALALAASRRRRRAE